eukprot:GHVN01106886.1.p1 GENE.GHVN01106886.1~~GHVN01106886.1.p1  ORF type:complete len:627 (+),score=156.42 GHVN01106886.1:249-2129(+)
MSKAQRSKTPIDVKVQLLLDFDSLLTDLSDVALAACRGAGMMMQAKRACGGAHDVSEVSQVRDEDETKSDHSSIVKLPQSLIESLTGVDVMNGIDSIASSVVKQLRERGVIGKTGETGKDGHGERGGRGESRSDHHSDELQFIEMSKSLLYELSKVIKIKINIIDSLELMNKIKFTITDENMAYKVTLVPVLITLNANLTKPIIDEIFTKYLIVASDPIDDLKPDTPSTERIRTWLQPKMRTDSEKKKKKEVGVVAFEEFWRDSNNSADAHHLIRYLFLSGSLSFTELVEKRVHGQEFTSPHSLPSNGFTSPYSPNLSLSAEPPHSPTVVSSLDDLDWAPVLRAIVGSLTASESVSLSSQMPYVWGDDAIERMSEVAELSEVIKPSDDSVSQVEGRPLTLQTIEAMCMAKRGAVEDSDDTGVPVPVIHKAHQAFKVDPFTYLQDGDENECSSHLPLFTPEWLKSHGTPGEVSEARCWLSLTCSLSVPVEYSGVIESGYGRGSGALGIPTANLKCDPLKPLSLRGDSNPTPLLAPGIYIGTASLPHSYPSSWPMVASFGFSPFYDNDVLTLEVFIFNRFGDEDLRGSPMTISITGILRCESSFSNFAHLVKAIQLDCMTAYQLLRAQ